MQISEKSKRFFGGFMTFSTKKVMEIYILIMDAPQRKRIRTTSTRVTARHIAASRTKLGIVSKCSVGRR